MRGTEEEERSMRRGECVWGGGYDLKRAKGMSLRSYLTHAQEAGSHVACKVEFGRPYNFIAVAELTGLVFKTLLYLHNTNNVLQNSALFTQHKQWLVG